MGVSKGTQGTYKRKRIVGVRLSGEDKNNQGWWDRGKEKHTTTLIANIMMISNTNTYADLKINVKEWPSICLLLETSKCRKKKEILFETRFGLGLVTNNSYIVPCSWPYCISGILPVLLSARVTMPRRCSDWGKKVLSALVAGNKAKVQIFPRSPGNPYYSPHMHISKHAIHGRLVNRWNKAPFLLYMGPRYPEIEIHYSKEGPTVSIFCSLHLAPGSGCQFHVFLST